VRLSPSFAATAWRCGRRALQDGPSNGVGNAGSLASVGERTRRPDQLERGFGDGRGHRGAGRLDAVNPKINAVVDYHPEDVLAHARGIDAAIARGEDAGPLAGVPVTVRSTSITGLLVFAMTSR